MHVSFIPQVGRTPQLIFDFTWSGLKNIAECLPTMEVMHFRGAILRIFKQVLSADPHLGPVYLRKVEFSDTYMRLWMGVEDFPSVTLLIPNKILIKT